jgi:dihydroxyacetone kinase
LSLAQVKAEAEAAAANLFTMGLGLGACIVPAAGKRGFELGDTEVEYGLGIHGESGAKRGAIAPADEMLDQVLDKVIARGGLKSGDRVALLINNLGGSSVQEMSIVARHAFQRLVTKGVKVEASLVGSYLTALEMPGVSVSLMKLDDARLKKLLAPAAAGAWTPPTLPGTLEAVKVAKEATGAEAAGQAWEDASHRDKFAKAIAAVIGALQKEEKKLTELDAIVGDGDIGISLTRGAQSIAALGPRLDIDHPAAALRDISATLRRSLGGTSGPLYAVFILRMAVSLSRAKNPSEMAAWAAAFRAGVDGIQTLGGGKAGDRTMLDALIPAAEALEQGAQMGAAVRPMLQAMIAAAEGGVEGTKAMKPRLGRSSYVGDRAIGNPDPGAYAVVVWLKAIASAI